MDIKKLSIFKKKRFWAGILLAQFVLFYLFSKNAACIHLFERFFEWQKNFHVQLFSDFNFSLGDIIYLLCGVFLIFVLINVLRKSKRNSAWIKFLAFVNVFYFMYQIFWGMLYFQKPLIEKLPQKEPTEAQIKALALVFLEKCRKTRELVQEDRNGVFKVYGKEAVKKEILSRQNLIPKQIHKKAPIKNLSFKPSLYESVMSFSGILGYFNPFTAEAQYNPNLPSNSVPFTLAHESAHQLGYAREQEANFIGYLIGIKSENLELRYSTEYFALKSLLNSLTENNPEFVKYVIRNYSAGMKRDRLAEKMFVYKHRGILDSFFGFTNDLFLKSNQQEGSVTYSYFVDLLVRYETQKLQ